MKKIIVCLLLFFSSCILNNNRNEQQGQDEFNSSIPYKISLEQAIDNIIPALLTEVGGSITYIPLETTDGSLLRELKKIIVTDAHITVYDNSHILIFKSSGHFLRQIGRKGQGPGEYSTLIYDYCLSLDGQNIYFLAGNNTCFEFEVEGKFLNSFKIDSVTDQLLPITEDLFVFHCINYPKYRNPIGQSLIISDLNNNITKTYKNYHKRTSNPGISVTGHSPLFFHQGDIRFKEFGVDTLYTVTIEELIPHAILNLGEKELPADLQLPRVSDQASLDRAIKALAGKFWVKGILEDVDNLYITLNDLTNNLYGYYNKRNNTLKVIGEVGFQNDIDGGLPFFPKYVYNDDILVDYVSAFTLREHILKGNAAEMRKLYCQNYDDLVKLANSLDDESNPIVVMVKK